MQKWICGICGFIYDPAVGMPEHDIAPGTAFESLPEDWVCPECGSPVFSEAPANPSLVFIKAGTLDDIEASNPTIEEREEFEPHIQEGGVVFAGVDYAAETDPNVAVPSLS